MDTQKTETLPHITGLAGKLLYLQRRGEYLSEQIENRRGSDGALQFATKELEAIEAAVDALRYHRAMVEGLDTPLALLREVMESEKLTPSLAKRVSQLLDEYEA